MKLQPMHRARRFLRMLRPEPPSATELVWAVSQLPVAERPLFAALDAADQEHSIRVARAVEVQIDGVAVEDGDREWIIRAALLHDVGKSVTRVGPVDRAVATLLGWVGRGRVQSRWSDVGGRRGAIAEYLSYPDRGADMLRRVGSDSRVVAWAAEHHRSPAHWSVPLRAGAVLAAADDAA